MEYLLTAKNLGVLESFSFIDTLFAFDFDGTLSPIVDSPDDACLSEAISEKLKLLNELVTLAIMTGRSLKDIKTKLPFNPKYIIGNHGIESSKNSSDLKNMAELCKTWVMIIDQFYSEMLKDLGIVLENKEFSLSFHYRQAKDIKIAEGFILKLASQLPEAKILKGKLVVNVIPFLSMNKGDALLKLLKEENYRFCVYIGDDVTDEDVFNLSRPDLLTIKIGNDLSSSAKYYLKGQDEIDTFLEFILDQCSNII